MCSPNISWKFRLNLCEPILPLKTHFHIISQSTQINFSDLFRMLFDSFFARFFRLAYLSSSWWDQMDWISSESVDGVALWWHNLLILCARHDGIGQARPNVGGRAAVSCNNQARRWRGWGRWRQTGLAVSLAYSKAGSLFTASKAMELKVAMCIQMISRNRLIDSLRSTSYLHAV